MMIDDGAYHGCISRTLSVLLFLRGGRAKGGWTLKKQQKDSHFKPEILGSSHCCMAFLFWRIGGGCIFWGGGLSKDDLGTGIFVLVPPPGLPSPSVPLLRVLLGNLEFATWLVIGTDARTHRYRGEGGAWKVLQNRQRERERERERKRERERDSHLLWHLQKAFAGVRKHGVGKKRGFTVYTYHTILYHTPT